MALAPPAEAGHLDWSFGVGFHVGGLHFQVGFAPTGHAGYPGPFFFTAERLHYRGYGCSGLCFRRGGGYYHHASCPLVGFHFRRGGHGPDYYVSRYAPYPSYGYRSYGRGYSPRPYGYYYRPGYRYRPYGGHYYRDRHDRGRHYRDRRDHRYRDHRGGRGDRGWGRDRDHDSDSDRRRGYRDRGGRDDQREYRGDSRGHGGGGRHQAEPRRGARRTRPPH
jgi:hypothetical protein